MALIKGTAFDDFLVVGGSDTLLAMGGNDVVLMTPGNSGKVDGGAGFDRLWFSSGVPIALAYGGGSAGVEEIQIANAVGDSSGTTAVDIFGWGLTTGLRLFGNDGANGLAGGKGADTIAGNGGVDNISGGLGADRIVMDVTAGDADDVNGGALSELNTLALVGAATAIVTVDLAATGDQVGDIDGRMQSGFANIDASGMTGFGVQVTGSTLKNVIIGSAQDDIFLFGSAAALGTSDVVSGGGGNDVLRFTSTTAGDKLTLGANVLVESAVISDAAGATTGTVKLSLNAAAMTSSVALTGNDGVNSLTGGAGNDTLAGNDGADTLSAGAGNDILDGGLGVDTLAGGAGNDTYEVNSQAEHGALDQISDSAGTDDRIAFASAVDGEKLVLGAKVTGIESVYLTNLAFDTTGTAALQVDASALLAKVSLVGNAGANLLTGGIGADTIAGNGGADTVAGGGGADRIEMSVAAGSVDQIDAGAATELNTLALVGAPAADVYIDLSAADQLVRFGASADALVQTGFANVDASGLNGFGVQVTASALRNNLTGSTQDDVFLYLTAAAAVGDTIDGGGGSDSIRFFSAVAGQTLVLGNVTGIESAAIADDNGFTTGFLKLGINASALASGISLVGNDGVNVLIGGSGADTLNGNADNTAGGAGADLLQGGMGDDVYVYDSAADFGAGERISDTGGLDTVQFVSTVGGEILTLSSGVTGVEKYELDASGTANIGIDLHLVLSAASVTGNAMNNAITGTDAAAGDTLAGGLGSDTLDGRAGGDSLAGGGGADSIAGGAGNDRIEGGDGLDTISGGTGDDTIVMSVDAGQQDAIDAGAATEKNMLVLVGDGPAIVDLSVAAGADQVNAGDGLVQKGFAYVDASGISALGGVIVTGRDTGIGDSIIGSAGNDVFYPGLGPDTIEGGKGDDFWVITSAAELTGDQYNDNGGDFGDNLFIDAGVDGTTFTFSDDNLNGIDVVALGNPFVVDAAWTANTNIDASANSEAIGLAGNAGDNRLIGTSGSESFFDYGGKDTVKGGDGSDEYIIIAPWVTGELIDDSGGTQDDVYVAYNGLLTVKSSEIKGIERFIVSNADLPTPSTPTGYGRDITAPVNGSIDAHLYGSAILLSGSYGVNTLTGTNFADTIIGWRGHDSVAGGGGADVITLDVTAADTDDINAGALSEGNVLDLTGTPDGVVSIDLALSDQLQRINGVTEARLQSGFLHVDASLMVGAGAIIAGTGGVGAAAANTLTGSGQDDVLIGRGGADVLNAGGGNDAIVVASQAEFNAIASMDGGSGVDTLRFSASSPTALLLTVDGTKAVGIEAVALADASGDTSGTSPLQVVLINFTTGMTLVGNDGNNSMYGTNSADSVAGGGGNDTILGQDGNDTIDGGDGNDLLNGGTGNDLYLISSAAHFDALDSISDSFGSGDTLKFTSTVDHESLTLGARVVGVENVVIGDDALNLNLDVDAALLPNKIVLTGNQHDNHLGGTAFADTINGGLGHDTIVAGAGADVVTMAVDAADLDDLDAGAIGDGNKLVLTGDPGGAMVWDLSNGTDQLVSINGADEGHVITGVTSLDAGSLTVDLTITGSAEANSLTGGSGNDIFITATPLLAGEVIAAGGGNDALQFASAINGQTLTLTRLVTGIESVQIIDATASVGVNAALVLNALAITGNAGSNAITGTAYADTIVGGLGADTIVAGAGADTITVDVAAADAINAGAVSAAEANKLVLVGAASATVVANLSLIAANADQLASEAGIQSGFTHLDASLVTGFGVNVTGSDSANLILGTNAQADTIVGGKGADTIGVDAASGDSVDAGLVTEGNLLLLNGPAAGTLGIDLGAVDQLSLAGTQSGFQHVDASAVTGFGVDVTGSAAANRITGTALSDTIAGGAGADTISLDVSGGADDLDAGAGGEGDLLVLTGDAAGTVTINLSVAPGADQTDVNGLQSDFQHVDASAMGLNGVNITGNGLDNRLTGTAFNDIFDGGAGADTFVLGTGSDQVIYGHLADGANSVAALASFDRIREFTVGSDKIDFGADFNGGSNNLDDITANDQFAFAIDRKADFSATDEALLITSGHSGVKTELALSNFSGAVAAINKLGLVSAAGDDGLILVQELGGTAAAPMERTGIYYYQESDGIANKVSASELTLLGIVEARITDADVSLI